MFMQKTFSTCSLNHFFYLNVCNWKEDFVFPLDMTLICLDPSPGSSSVQITHVAILKYFDNLCLLGKLIYFHAAVPNSYCLELLFVRVYFVPSWFGVKPCSCCYEFSMLGNFNWCFFGF